MENNTKELEDLNKSNEIVDNKSNKTISKYGKKNMFKKRFIQYIFITIGVIFIDISFYFFLEPSGVVIGGAMGLSILITPFIKGAASWFTSSTFLYIINTIALIMGLILLGKDFFFKTIYATLLSPTLLLIFELVFDSNFFISTIGDQALVKLVSMVCGGLLTGFGVGIALKNDGSTGGMDVFQKILSKYLKIPFSKTLYMTDWVVVFFTGFVLIGQGFTWHFQIANVLFGVIGAIISGFVSDTIILSTVSRRTVYVITDKPDLIKEIIYSHLERGVTLVDAKGGYTGNNYTMLICTMDKTEAYRITSLISDAEPHSFVFVSSCKEVKGQYHKRGLL